MIVVLAGLLPGTPLRELLDMYVDDGVEILTAAGTIHCRAGKKTADSSVTSGSKTTSRMTGGLDVLSGFMKHERR